MTDPIWDLTLTEFRDRAASDSPTPGGGSVSAVAAALGLSLVLMALRVTARRNQQGEALAPLVVAAEKLQAEMAAHAAADIAAFDTYMAAHRRPRGTEQEKADRRLALRGALLVATEVPLGAAQSILEALDVARQATEVAALDIMSDAAAGAALLHGALTAVLFSVDVNLRMLGEAPEAAAYATSRRHLQQDGDRTYGGIGAALARRAAQGQAATR